MPEHRFYINQAEGTITMTVDEFKAWLEQGYREGYADGYEDATDVTLLCLPRPNGADATWMESDTKRSIDN